MPELRPLPRCGQANTVPVCCPVLYFAVPTRGLPSSPLTFVCPGTKLCAMRWIAAPRRLPTATNRVASCRSLHCLPLYYVPCDSGLLIDTALSLVLESFIIRSVHWTVCIRGKDPSRHAVWPTARCSVAQRQVVEGRQSRQRLEGKTRRHKPRGQARQKERRQKVSEPARLL